MYRNIIWIACLLLTGLQSRAQSYWENYELLTTRQGLPHNIVLSMLQDSAGYLWVGTYNGLCRYNGHTFETYKDVFGPTQSNNWFHAIEVIYEDHNRDIWIGSRGGMVSRFDRAGQSFSPCRQSDVANKVQAFYEDGKGRIWIGCQNGALGKVQGDSIVYVANAGTRILAISETAAKIPFIVTENGVQVYDSVSGFQPYAMGGLPARHSILIALPLHPYWVMRTNMYYALADMERKTIVKALQPMLYDRVIYSQIAPGTNGFIAADEFRVRRYNMAGDCIDSFDISNNAWNNNHEIHNCLLQDKTGIVWLGTNSGLYKIDPQKYSFRKYARNNTAYLLRDNYVRTLYAHGKELWVGTKDGAINQLLYDAQQDKYIYHKSYELHAYGNAPDHYTINCFVAYGDDMLAAGEGAMLFILKKGRHFFEEDHRIKSPFGGQGIWTLYADDAGNIWIGTHKEGLYIWEAATQKLYRYNDTAKGQYHINAKSVWNIYKDKTGVLWLGTDNGHYRVHNAQDVSNLHLQPYLQQAADGQHINVWSMAEDNYGNMWLGTTGHGLFQLTAGRDKYISYGNRPNNVISALAGDATGGLWISTVNGLYRYDIAKMQFAGYDEQDGLLSNEFNFKAASQTPNGLLCFGNKTGMVCFRPKEVNKRTGIDVPVLISGLEIAGNDTAAALYAPGPVTLPYNSNFIDLQFCIPEFSKPLSHRYRYRLEGLDQQWRETGAAQASATYGNLAPGSYRFVVYGAADGTHWGSTPAVFSFVIRPALWQSAAFRIIIAALLFLTAAWLVYRRIQMVIKREREKHRIEKEIASLELRALQAQMNPHFIFNAINSIQHFILHNDVLAANDYLSRFARLMRLFLESSKNRYINLQTEIELLQLYLQLEQLRFDDKFSFGMHVDDTIDKHHVNIPPALIQPFVENAVNHGLVHYKGKGHLQILFVPDGRYKIKCIIDDNGVGRKQAAAIKAQHRKNHVSRGMQLIEERVKTYNFIDELDIYIHIVDKNLPQQGTRVEITIPIGPIQ